MSKVKRFASLKEIESELSKLDFPRLLEKLESYAQSILIDKNPEISNGIVHEVFEKLLTQERKWYEGQPLNKMIFGAVKSLCHNSNKKTIRRQKGTSFDVDLDSLTDSSDMSPSQAVEISELKELALKILRSHDPPPDYLEEMIFECWIEGMLKPQLISQYLEENITEIRKGVKRLNRKLGPVQEVFNKLIYGKG